MASLFLQYLCCCLRTDHDGNGEPDEHTRLIQTTDEIPPNVQDALDLHKMRERLGSIVRSKEGKMVNVNTPLPFNLHNRSLHQRLDMSSSRSDHSVSGRTSPVRPLASTSKTRVTIDPSIPPHARGRASRTLSPSLSRDPSPSLETSRSTSSLHPGDASYLPPEEDPEYGVRKPILNVRLVRHHGAVSQAYGIRMRQGRSTTRGRLGRFGDDSGGGEALHAGNEAGANGTIPITVTFEGQGDRTPNGLLGANEGVASPAQGSDKLTPTNTPITKFSTPEDEADPTSPTVSTFKIRDVGKISQSWGD